LIGGKKGGPAALRAMGGGGKGSTLGAMGKGSSMSPFKGKGGKAAAQTAEEAMAAKLKCAPRQVFDHAFFKNRVRQLPPRSGAKPTHLELEVPTDLIKEALPARPVVSIFCFRWWNYWSDWAETSDYNVLNDGLFQDLFHGPYSLTKQIPGEFEVFTVWINHSRDFKKLDANALRSLAKGRNVVAWYFVWPSSDLPYGFVSQRNFFAFLQAMERTPIRTCWPHESHLYRLLCGKIWIPNMCLSPEFRVPPTTRLHYSEFKANGLKACTRALNSLMKLRKRIWGKEPSTFDEFRCVVKLGFSWGGNDVLPCKGISAMIANLKKLFEQEGNDSTDCLVQEMVPGIVGEHRVMVFHNRKTHSFHKEKIWMASMKPAPGTAKFDNKSTDVAEFKLASSNVVPQDEVASKFFGGDIQAQHVAEAAAQKLVDKWLMWYATESAEPPQCTRIDFLVSHPSKGRAEIWTCEVGECGASLCSIEVDGRNIVALNKAILRDRPGQDRFPVALPFRMQRNNGYKS